MHGRQAIAGFLAGACGVVAALLGLSFVFISGGVIELMRDASYGLRGEIPFWQTLLQSLVQSFSSTPILIWSARWGVLVLGGLGVALAFADAYAQRSNYRWPRMISFVLALGVVTGISIALQYINREMLVRNMPDQISQFNQRHVILLPDPSIIALGLLIGIPIAYVVWAIWQWWFVRWSRWLRLPARTQPDEMAAPEREESMIERQARLSRAKRGLPSDQAPTTVVSSDNGSALRVFVRLGAVLAIALVLCAGALMFYHTVRADVSGGDLWVAPESPQDGAALRFDRAPQRLSLYSLLGGGMVDITITDGRSLTPVRPVEQLELAGEIQQQPVVHLAIDTLPPGTYQLNVALRDGAGGGLNYIATQGGGILGQLAAWLIGITAGIVLVSAVLLLLEGISQRRRRPAF